MRNLIENSIEKLARILASQYHIDVIFEGNSAYTDGKKIVLPNFENMTEELKRDLNAYCDHEVAHCKFTKMDEMKKTISKFHGKMLNAVEDVRIEREMIEEFPGVRFNLEPLNAKLMAKIFEQWDEMPALVRVLINITQIMLGEELRIDKDIEKHISVIRKDCEALNACRSTSELREITEKIVKLIEEEETKSEKEEGEGTEAKSDKDKGSETKKGKGKGKSDDRSESKGDDSEKSGDDTSEGKGKVDSKGKSKVRKRTDKTSTVKEMLADQEGEPSVLDEFVTDVHGLMDEEIKEAIKEDPSSISRDTLKPVFEGTRSIPATTRFDSVTDHSNKGSAASYAALKRDVMGLINPVKSQLEKILKVKENAKWSLERERGGIDAKNLNKMLVNQNHRKVFREYTKTETNNVAIQILVDMSGSMCGRMDTAKRACVAMSESLKALDIKFEVTGFNSRRDSRVARFSTSLGDTSRFNRTSEMLDLHIFKSFDAHSLTGISEMFVGSENPDGECVTWAAKRLAERKEKRKILLVLSDGEPASSDSRRGILCADLKNKVALLKKMGVECIGIGIESEAVKHFYPDYIVLKNVKDLPKEAMRKLAKIVGG